MNMDVVMVMNGDKRFDRLRRQGSAHHRRNQEECVRVPVHDEGAGDLVCLVKDKSYELSMLEESKVEGKSAVGVLVKSKGHKDISLFFDKQTGLLAKVKYKTNDPMTGNEVIEERIFARYGTGKEGIPVVKQEVVKHDGETFMKIEVVEGGVLESLDDGAFKK